MHIEKFRFDSIFDVVAHRGDFSFSSQGRTEYGVRLQNGLIPREGSTFAIAYAEPGNWNTVLGWRDLAAAEVTLKCPMWLFWLDKLSDIALGGMFFTVGGLLFGGPKGAAAAALVIVLVLFVQGYRAMRLNRAVRQALH
jgi:hypothetical protein